MFTDKVLCDNPLTIDLMLTRGVVSETPCRSGNMYYFRNDFGSVSESLLTYGEWAENEIRFLLNFIREGSVIVDAGGYIGTHALRFGKAVGSTGRVYSFEAQPASFCLLEHNIIINRGENIISDNAILGTEASSEDVPLSLLDLERRDNFGGAVATEASHQRTYRIRQRTLDSLALQACDVIKIDVEGMETQVLSGAAALIARCRPFIYAECNTVENGYRICKALRDFGYDTFLHVVDIYNADNFFGIDENIFGQAREAAIIGVDDHHLATLRSVPRRSCETLLRVDSIDDLVAGMLIKPQYVAATFERRNRLIDLQ